MQRVDPKKVRRAFARAAKGYAEAAALQREVAERLDAHLNFTKIKPNRILDLGCGTGFLAHLLHARYPKAEIVLVDIAEPMLVQARKRWPKRWFRRNKARFCCADACRLPFADASFDLVASNLTLQWVAEPMQMLAEMRRVCRTGGLLLFSTFGRRTLEELRYTLAAIDRKKAARVLVFPDVMQLGDMLHAQAVETTVADADRIVVHYPSVRALLAELKAIGATASALPNGPKGLGGRAFLRALEEHYRARYADAEGRVRATFEVLYAQAWARKPGKGERACAIPIRAVPPGV